MRIVDARTTIVSIPFSRPETWAFGRKLGVSNVIIELHTDAGLVGLGEAMGFPRVRVVNEILQDMLAVVIGRDPTEHGVILHELSQRFGWYHYNRSGNCPLGGLEIALWDLVGKMTRQPLHKLFGGAFRNKIKYYWFVPDGAPEVMAKEGMEGVQRGFDTVYVKLGTGFDRDLEIVRVMRETLGPKPKIRVDANEAWADGTAFSLIRKMAQYDIEFFEQPLLCHDHDGAANLRKALGVAIGANQSAWTESDIVEIIKRGAADVIVTDQHQLGGISRLHRVAWMLAVLGIPIVKHSFGDLGISSAAARHVLACCPNATRAHQTHCGLLTDDIVEGGLEEFDGDCLPIKNGPGLGVSLDPARLAKYADYYEQHGDFPAFGDGEDLGRKYSGASPEAAVEEVPGLTTSRR